MADESLATFIDAVCSESHLRVEDDLGGGFVRLRSEEAERRQAAHDIRSTEDIVIEMLRNARDAHAHVIFLAVSREDNERRIVMIDDGDGIPSHMHRMVFEPRVTSKLDSMHMDKWGVHGRGMALYSISVNAEEARVVASAEGLGSALAVRTNLESVGEKADQSTFPRFEAGEGATVNVRGPKNIIRTACEFALEHRTAITVFVGSPAEIAASLYAYASAIVSPVARAFAASEALESLPYVKRFAYAADAAELASLAAAVGIDISTRTAHRILEGELAPAQALLQRIQDEGFKRQGSAVPSGNGKSAEHASHSAAQGEAGGSRAYGSLQDDAGAGCTGKASGAASLQKPPHIAPEDLEEFRQNVARAYADLAERYYLLPDAAMQVVIGKEGLKVSIPLIRAD